MFSKLTFVIAQLLFCCICESSFVNKLTKCSYKDDKCSADMIQNILKEISKTGNKDVGMPPIEPLHLQKLSLPILGLFNMTLDEEQVNGIKDCIISRIHNYFEVGVSNVDVKCDLTITATFTLDNLSPFIISFLGQDARHITGNANVKIDNLRLNGQVFHSVIKKDDEELYFKINLKKFVIDIDIGNLQIKINKLLFGQKDLSEFVEVFLNQNWRSILVTYGGGVYEVAKNILRDMIANIIESIPAKYMYTDDLTAFLKN